MHSPFATFWLVIETVSGLSSSHHLDGSWRSRESPLSLDDFVVEVDD